MLCCVDITITQVYLMKTRNLLTDLYETLENVNFHPFDFPLFPQNKEEIQTLFLKIDAHVVA